MTRTHYRACEIMRFRDMNEVIKCCIYAITLLLYNSPQLWKCCHLDMAATVTQRPPSSGQATIRYGITFQNSRNNKARISQAMSSLLDEVQVGDTRVMRAAPQSGKVQQSGKLSYHKQTKPPTQKSCPCADKLYIVVLIVAS